jgi:hypothetical protein
VSLKDWWRDIKDLFVVPPEPKPPQEQKHFIPPHSLPESELPPKWPKKEDRQ